MIVSMDKKYTLGGEPFTVLTVTKPGLFPVLGYSSPGVAHDFRADGSNAYARLIEVGRYADFKIDEPVMVRDFSESKWERRYFAGVNVKGVATAWNNGAMKWATELSPTVWSQCRRPTAEELSS